MKIYLDCNVDGVKDAVVQMMGGESILINIRTFANDMRTFHGRDDILTLLVHLGYLSYDESAKTVSIPNREIAVEYASSIGVSHQYSALASSLQESRGSSAGIG